jgi:hypothetical protein
MSLNASAKTVALLKAEAVAFVVLMGLSTILLIHLLNLPLCARYRRDVANAVVIVAFELKAIFLIEVSYGISGYEVHRCPRY